MRAAGDLIEAVVEAAEHRLGDWRAHAKAGDIDGAIRTLAALRPLEYDRIREEAAKVLRCRATTLDEEVRRARNADGGTDAGARGRPLELSKPEPWPQPVGGAELLEELVAAIRRHVALSGEAALAVALWTVWTHLVDRFDIAPRLLVRSPQPRCGKSTLMRLVAELVPRAVPASNVTPSALFRLIERERPTLLLDEADTFLRDSEQLRGLVNSGHERSFAYVVRSVEAKGDYEPRTFPTWCALAIAGIGTQHATIEDRSIVIELQRRLPDERIERLDGPAKERLRGLARRIARFAADVEARIADREPEFPAGLHDRACDNWRPLFLIAEAAGGLWPERARAAALKLAGSADERSLGVQLLADIREIFRERGDPEELPSRTLCDALAAMEDRPWSEIGRGRPITPRKLAVMLRHFGVHPRHGKHGNLYRRAPFLDIWARYLPAWGCKPSNLHPSYGQADFPPTRTFTGNGWGEGSKRPSNPCGSKVGEGLKVQRPEMNHSLHTISETPASGRHTGDEAAPAVNAALARAEAALRPLADGREAWDAEAGCSVPAEDEVDIDHAPRASPPPAPRRPAAVVEAMKTGPAGLAPGSGPCRTAP